MAALSAARITIEVSHLRGFLLRAVTLSASKRREEAIIVSRVGIISESVIPRRVTRTSCSQKTEKCLQLPLQK